MWLGVRNEVGDGNTQTMIRGSPEACGEGSQVAPIAAQDPVP